MKLIAAKNTHKQRISIALRVKIFVVHTYLFVHLIMLIEIYSNQEIILSFILQYI